MSFIQDEVVEETTAGTPYGRKVGECLRAIRRQKRLSLQEVEGASQQEFKASVLGAYERGERAISVPRLQRLARFYHVPVDQLLPQDEGPAGGATPQGPAAGTPASTTGTTGSPAAPAAATSIAGGAR